MKMKQIITAKEMPKAMPKASPSTRPKSDFNFFLNKKV
jgi:hypothetical protein